MLSLDNTIVPHPLGINHHNLQDAASKLDYSPRLPSKPWNTGLLTPPSSPKPRISLHRLSLNLLDLDLNVERPTHRRGHNIIPLPAVTPLSPKSFCRNIHRYEEYLSNLAMNVNEYVPLGQQESCLPFGTCSSRSPDSSSSPLPSLNHLDLPGFPPKNSLLFRIDSVTPWQACSAIQNQIFLNAGFPEASHFSAFA